MRRVILEFQKFRFSTQYGCFAYLIALIFAEKNKLGIILLINRKFQPSSAGKKQKSNRIAINVLLCEASKHFGCGYFSLGMWFYNHSFQIICHSYVFVGKMG